jgi:hypothetical protein
MSARGTWISLVGLALVVALSLMVPRLGKQLARPEPSISQQLAPAPAAPTQITVELAIPSATTEEPSHLADGLNSPTADVHSDLRLVNAIFDAYRSSVRSGNPVGENSEITAALTGRNKLGFAFIPKDSPAINSKGELCDRWGKPYFFHQISGERMEIRSGGPDQKMWTSDDEVLTP